MPRGVPRKKTAVYVAHTTFFSEAGDAVAGVTRVNANSDLYKTNPQYFTLVEGDESRGVETATADPEDDE
jgi:hypothetical protein